MTTRWQYPSVSFKGSALGLKGKADASGIFLFLNQTVLRFFARLQQHHDAEGDAIGPEDCRTGTAGWVAWARITSAEKDGP